jgi:6-phosphogluconolactonase
MSAIPTFELFESADQVAAETAARILRSARRAIDDRGRFVLVLAGGRTPLAAYNLLVGRSADWERWHIFLGDERCLPAADPDRNSVAVRRSLLDRVPIPPPNWHPIAAERGAEDAAALYEQEVSAALPFDLVLLGMGEDGHTASLFPGHEMPADRLVVPVHGAPKPPPDRVSMTARALTAASELLILVTGASKREVLRAWRAGEDFPVGRVAAAGPARVLVDRDAAG